MAWNNGLERNIFDEEQKRLAAEYRDAGMTEEQIEQMYQFDLDAFNSTRRFFEHNQQIPDNIFGTDDEGLCPLNDKFLEVMSVTKEQSDVKSRYWWIEEIEDPQLAQKVRALPEKDIELITLIAFENYTHKEASVLFGVTRSGVTKRVEQLRKYFQKNS
ncbi:MAG: sigma factor-like helix-turn-helix DNA-binding protein [Eubacteriales bacterium]|jgi:DNA-directed RNA polymerase specialized sigma subunit